MEDAKSTKIFTKLGSCKITDTTNLVISSCEENGEFKGFYISKQFPVKDSSEPDKKVMVFTKGGAIRIKDIEQLKELSKVFEEVVKKIS